MKVYLNVTGLYRGIVSRLESEGASLTDRKDNADVWFDEPIELPDPLVDHLKDQTDVTEVTHCLTTFVEGNRVLPQTLLVIPLKGLMNGNLGDSSVVAGTAARYVHAKNSVAVLKDESVLRFVEGINHKGFLSFRYSGSHLLGVQTGIPWYGVYPCLEGVFGPVAEWFHSPKKVFETWVVGLLVTHPPYPFKTQVLGEIEVEGFSDVVRRHFWPLCGKIVNGRILTNQTLLGIATAHGKGQKNLQFACEMAVKTARSVKCDEIQYRTDPYAQFSKQYERIVTSDWI